MPYKDPEARKEYMREYSRRPEVMERHNSRGRAARAADPETARAKDRERYATKPERREQLAASSAASYAANREKALDRSRSHYAANRDRRREQNRVSWLRASHGLTPERFAEIWRSQAGLCYLCARPLSDNLRHVHIEHDHACCAPGRSCDYCRRGLACQGCNKAIGLFADDPDLMERAAASLRIAKAKSQQRIASKPVQGVLPLSVVRLERREESAG